MRGVSRQLQTTRRERVNVGLSLTVFLTHMLSHHVVSRCFCQFELRPCCLFWRSSDWTEIWVWNRWFGNDLFRLGLHQWWTISRTCCELFLSLELNWGFSSFHNFGGRPTFSPVLGIFSFRFCSLELGIRSSPSCCVQGKLETLKVSLDL